VTLTLRENYNVINYFCLQKCAPVTRLLLGIHIARPHRLIGIGCANRPLVAGRAYQHLRGAYEPVNRVALVA
jgi:hypothetical protein